MEIPRSHTCGIVRDGSEGNINIEFKRGSMEPQRGLGSMAEIGDAKLGLESTTNKNLTWVDIRKPTREKMKILEEVIYFMN